MPLIEDLRRRGRRGEMRRALTTPVPRLGPYHVGIIPTYRCDYGCVFCALGLGEKSDRPDLDIRLLPPLLEDLSRLLTWEVSLTGGGEPSVHPEFRAIARMIQQAGFRLTISSHGRWLARKGWEVFADPGTTFHVSLNAARPETYDRVHQRRRPGTFEAICRALAEIGTGGGAAGRVALSFIFCRENAGEVREFFDLALRLRAASVVYRMIIPHPRYEAFLPTPEQIARAFADLVHVRRLAESPGAPELVLGDNFLPVRTNRERARDALRRILGKSRERLGPRELLHRLRAWRWKTTGAIPCLEGFFNAYVESDGTVFACHGGGSGHADNVVGNLNEERFAAIWDGPRYQAFRMRAARVDTGIAGNSLFPHEDTCLRCPKRDLFANVLAVARVPPAAVRDAADPVARGASGPRPSRLP